MQRDNITWRKGEFVRRGLLGDVLCCLDEQCGRIMAVETVIARRSEIRAQTKYLHRMLGTLPVAQGHHAPALSNASTLSIRTDGK